MQKTGGSSPTWTVSEFIACAVVALLCAGVEAAIVQIMGGWLDPWAVGICLSIGYMFDLSIMAVDTSVSPVPQAAITSTWMRCSRPLAHLTHRSCWIKRLVTAIETTHRGRACAEFIRSQGWGKVLAVFCNTACWVGLYQLGLGYYPRYGLPWMRWTLAECKKETAARGDELYWATLAMCGLDRHCTYRLPWNRWSFAAGAIQDKYCAACRHLQTGARQLLGAMARAGGLRRRSV